MSAHLRILAIEDDRDLADLYKSFLSWEGHDVLVARNGQEAVRLLKEHPDVVLLDLRLPDTNGAVLLRRMREHGTRTPVIVVSASVPETAPLPEADAVVSKPFDISDLLGTIYRVTHAPHAH